jgi:hypothetical protein
MKPEVIRFTVQNTPTKGIARYHVTRCRGGYQVSLHMAGHSVNIGKPTDKQSAMRYASDCCAFDEVRVAEHFKAAIW